MKRWWKILALSLVCGVTTTLFTGCFAGPNVDALNNVFNEKQTADENYDNITDVTTDITEPHHNDIYDDTNEERQTDGENNDNQDDPTMSDDNIDNPEPTVENNENNPTDENQSIDNLAPNENANNSTNGDNITPEPAPINSDDITDDAVEGTEKEIPTTHQHVSDNIWQPIKVATCTEDGTEVLICSDCGEIIQTRIISATGHDYNDLITPVTCTSGSYTTHHCIRCEYTYRSDETAPLNHDYQEKVIAPTCTDNGYTEHRCSHCGDYYKDSETTATGHNYNKETHQCTYCGENDPDYHEEQVQDLGPIENPLDSYWFYQYKKFAFYFKTFDAKTNSGTYCSYKGTFENNIFTKTEMEKFNYSGTYTIIPADNASGYVIQFYDEYCKKLNLLFDFTLTYKIDTTNDQTTYTLEGNFINEKYDDKTLTFAGYAGK